MNGSSPSINPSHSSKWNYHRLPSNYSSVRSYPLFDLERSVATSVCHLELRLELYSML